MTLFRIVISIRRYGISGVINWLRRLSLQPNALQNALESTLKSDIVPKKGITIVGNFSGTLSLSKVLRDFKISLSEARIPFQTFDTMSITSSDNFAINRYTDIFGMFEDFKIRGLKHCRQHRIVFWEFNTGFAKCHPHLIDGSPLVVFSDYCNSSIRSQIHSSMRVDTIRYPFHFDPPSYINQNDSRKKFDIPAKAFCVFFNFDYRSGYFRKNPEGLIAAFTEAFASVADAYLIIKTNGSDQKPILKDKLENAVSHSPISSRTRFFNDYISAEDLYLLTATCDVYASLHRGEGFGLGIAEAMSLGKAVIVSDCGATKEFCNPDTAMVIPYKLVKIPTEQIDHPFFKWVGEWPEPEIHLAAKAMRKLYIDPVFRHKLGNNAKEFIKTHFSNENFKKSMDSFFLAQEHQSNTSSTQHSNIPTFFQ